MVLGSVPMAFAGAYLFHVIGHSKRLRPKSRKYSAAALLVGAAAMVLRYVPGPTHRARTPDDGAQFEVRPVPTVASGWSAA